MHITQLKSAPARVLFHALGPYYLYVNDSFVCGCVDRDRGHADKPLAAALVGSNLALNARLEISCCWRWIPAHLEQPSPNL